MILLSLMLNCVLVNCDNRVKASFNESILIARHHQNLREVQTFFETLYQKIHDQRTAKTLDHATTGHDSEQHTTDLRDSTKDFNTFVSTPWKSNEGVIPRAYLPIFPLKSVKSRSLKATSSTPSITENWNKYFGLASPTTKTPHLRDYFSKYRTQTRKFAYLVLSPSTNPRLVPTNPVEKIHSEKTGATKSVSVPPQTSGGHTSSKATYETEHMPTDEPVTKSSYSLIPTNAPSTSTKGKASSHKTENVTIPHPNEATTRTRHAQKHVTNSSSTLPSSTPSSTPSKSTKGKAGSHKTETVTIPNEDFDLPSPPATTASPRTRRNRGYSSRYKKRRTTRIPPTEDWITDPTANLYEVFDLPSPPATTVTLRTRRKRRYTSRYKRRRKTRSPATINEDLLTDPTVDLYKVFGLPSTISSIIQTPLKLASYSLKSTLITSNPSKQSGLPTPTPSKPTQFGKAISHKIFPKKTFTIKRDTTVNLYKVFSLPSPPLTTIRPRTRRIWVYSTRYPKKQKPDFHYPTGYELTLEDKEPVIKVKVHPPILFSSETTPGSLPSKEEVERSFEGPDTILLRKVKRQSSPKTKNPLQKSQRLQNFRAQPVYQKKPSPLNYRHIYQRSQKRKNWELRSLNRTKSPRSRKPATSNWKSLTSTSRNYEKIWMQEMSSYTSADKWLHSATGRDVTPRYDAEKRPKNKHKAPSRRARGRLFNRQLRASRPPPEVHHQGISLPKTPEGHGSIISGERPVFKVQKIEETGVLYKASSPYKVYDDMMDQLQDGYMVVFLMELARLVASKDPSHVQDIIGHADSIVFELFERAQLEWFGQPLTDVTINIGRYLGETDIDGVRNYASTLYNLLRTRRSALPADVNSIIDGANQLFEPVEGYSLFDSLQEFAKYPDTARTGRQVCEGLIESFLRPFRRLHDSRQRQELLVSINDVLERRFTGYRLRRSENSDEENQSRSMKYVLKRTRKNKRRQRSHRRKLKTYHNESSHRRYFTKVQIFKLRNVKPITDNQKRFSVIIPKVPRSNTHTDAHYEDVRTRKTTDYTPTQAKKFFLGDKIGSFAGFGYIRESERHGGDLKTDGKVISAYLERKGPEEPGNVKVDLKTEMLNVDSSSYSDDAEILKSNLVQALMYGNGSRVDVTENIVLNDDVLKSVKDFENKQTVRPSEESGYSHEDRDSAIQNVL